MDTALYKDNILLHLSVFTSHLYRTILLSLLSTDAHYSHFSSHRPLTSSYPDSNIDFGKIIHPYELLLWTLHFSTVNKPVKKKTEKIGHPQTKIICATSICPLLAEINQTTFFCHRKIFFCHHFCLLPCIAQTDPFYGQIKVIFIVKKKILSVKHAY